MILCPTSDDQLYNCVGWDAYGSPDYFNSCSVSPDVSVPYNWGGYQQPSSGNAYVAIGTFGDPVFGYQCSDSTYCDSREYIGRSLSIPMTVGTKYFVSIKINLSLSNSIYCNCATNNIGILFSVNEFDFGIPNPTLIRNEAHIVSSAIVTDTAGWTTISGTLIADSAYQYITIGNFFDDPNTTVQIMDTNTYCNSYYYIDDVCVSDDSLTCISSVGVNTLNALANLFCYPNPAIDQLNVMIPDIGDNICAELRDSKGKIVMSTTNLFPGLNSLNVANIECGIYYLKLGSAQSIFSKRILIIH